METGPAIPNWLKNHTMPRRLLVLALLLVCETLFVTVRFDTGYIPNSYKLLVFMGHTGELLKLAVTMAGFLVVIGVYRYERLAVLVKDYMQWNGKVWIICHGVCFAVFLATTWIIFKFAWQRHFFINFAVLFWIAAGGATFGTLLLAAFPFKFWQAFFHQEKYTVLTAAVVGVIAWFLGRELLYYGKVLNGLTFELCYRVLGLFFEQPYVEAGERLLGISSFVIRIRSDCSGYEGIALVVVFLTVYLWLYRNILRFPHALLLFPIGVLTIWVFNIIRIVTLIIIGETISPRIALGGFHSNAGWIAFILTGMGLIWLCHRSALFNREDKSAEGVAVKKPITEDAVTALLLPFLVLIAAILLTQVVASDFDWLYPLRVIVCGVVLWLFRQYYRLLLVNLRWHALVIGTIVFVMWVNLVPFSGEQDANIAATLFSMPSGLMVFWVFFRIVGATITVPFIEELLFRGYLINRFTGQQNYLNFGHFSFLSFVLSSILFGLLHGQWLAGTLAGMGYAGALYVRRQLTDAVVAHMTTNAALALYVIYTGHWSLW